MTQPPSFQPDPSRRRPRLSEVANAGAQNEEAAAHHRKVPTESAQRSAAQHSTPASLLCTPRATNPAPGLRTLSSSAGIRRCSFQASCAGIDATPAVPTCSIPAQRTPNRERKPRKASSEKEEALASCRRRVRSAHVGMASFPDD